MQMKTIETLEPRRLLSVSFNDGTLRITGTDAADKIFIDSKPVFATDNFMHYGLVVHVNDQATSVGVVNVQSIFVDGGAGNDNIIIPRVINTTRSIPLHTGDQSVFHHVSVAANVNGGAGDDTIVGGRRADTLTGGAGNDLIMGGDGDDLMLGDTGNDTLIGEGGANVFSGGAGLDTADYAARTDNLVIAMTNSLSTRALNSSKGDHDRILRDVENLIGGSGNDSLTGNYFANVITGGAGNDTMNGMEGNDLLNGGAGDDTFTSNDRYVQQTFDNNGKPTAVGGGGAVILRGRDLIIGGGGNDRATIDVKDQAQDVDVVTNA